MAEDDFSAASETETVDLESANEDAISQDDTDRANDMVNCNHTSAALDEQTVDIDNEDRNVPAEIRSEVSNPQSSSDKPSRSNYCSSSTSEMVSMTDISQCHMQK